MLSISEFNAGPLQMIEIREVLGCGVSEHAVRLANSRMNTRVRISRKEERDKQKRRRQSVKEARQRRDQDLQAAEGGPTYGAGMF